MFSLVSDQDEKRGIIEILRVYRTLPALWDVNKPEYSTRSIKEQQYAILLEKFRETYPKADKKELTKKINLWRTNYKRELRRSRTEKGLYTPTLFYFETLNFLSNIVGPNQNCTKKPIQQVVGTKSEPEAKRKKPYPIVEKIQKVEQIEKGKHPSNSCQQIANVWGQKLSKMDRIQRIIAERVINEVMFNAELGLLNYNTGLCHIGKVNTLSTTPTPAEQVTKQEIITIDPNDIFGI